MSTTSIHSATLRPAVLTITGSDNTGGAGIQADIRTIAAMGGEALTAVTSVTVQDGRGIQTIMDLPCDLVVGQTRAVVEARHPHVAKVGMVRDARTIRALRAELAGCRQLVLVPGIVSSRGERLLDDEALAALRRWLIPEAAILLLRCNEAELLLGRPIATDDDMLRAAEALTDMGAGAVLLRGGHQTARRLTALLLADGHPRFFSSQNTDGWQRHGVGGALSSAIATRLALGDDVLTAVTQAHAYVHSRVVYAVEGHTASQRPADLYNALMTLVADNYRTSHTVSFYAERLAITPRYLSQVTRRVVGKSPKQVVDDYLAQEASALLLGSRLTIAEVARQLGFSSPAAFSRFFSESHGCAPRSFRNGSEHL